MNFNFILDKDYLSYYILNRKMYNENAEISKIKDKLIKDNDLGYKKILGQEILKNSIYFDDVNTKKLIKDFINTDKFNQIYKIYNNDSKENIAIKLLKGFAHIDDNELEKVKDNLWEKHMESYRKLLNMGSYNPTIFLLDKDVMNTINYLKSTNEFQKLYKETKLYIDNVERCWNENKDRINKYLKDILKVEIDIKLNVYISHPNCYNGYSFGENNVVWGHYKGIEDSNYNLVYLVHEGLHHLIPFEVNDNELVCYIKHSIIELASDYELYFLLNNESALTYGHFYLKKYKKIIYPYWLRYIGLNDYQIKERLEKDSINVDNYIKINNNDEANMNIYEFVNFLVKQWETIITLSKKAKQK